MTLGSAHRRKCHRLMVSAICGLLVVAVAAPALGAAETFDGVYIGKRLLTTGSGPGCPTEDDVSVTIHGAALTFTDSELRNSSSALIPIRTDHSNRSTPVAAGLPCSSRVA